MNTTVEINEETLPHLSKRLQKAIKEELGQDIKLATAYLLLAKATGKKDLFELKKQIKYSQANPSSAKDIAELRSVIDKNISVDAFMEELHNYQESPSDSTLKRVELFLEEGVPQLVFSAMDKKYSDTEASVMFSFYDKTASSCHDVNLSCFDDPNNSTLNELALSHHSMAFIRHLVDKYFPKDDATAVFIGKQFTKEFGITEEGGALLYNDESLVADLMFAPNLRGGRLFKKKYFVVGENFFDDNDIHFKKNLDTSLETTIVGNYLSQGVEIEEKQVFDYLSKVQRESGHIVIEVYEDCYSGKATISGKNTSYCSRIFIPDTSAKSVFICSVDGEHRVLIEDKSFAYYQGYLDNASFNFSVAYNPYRYVADPSFYDWRDGVKASITDRLKDKNQKKVFTGIARKP